MDARRFYDGLGDAYDLMVSWEDRLARERAFFQRLFVEAAVGRLLDAACGTGMHAIAFSRLGARCAGVDLSPVMVERARQNARAAEVDARFEVAGFGGISSVLSGPFDAVTCLGNSLPHLGDDASLDACLTDFAALLRPGGLLVIQNRNYDRLLRERQRFMPVSSRAEGDGETLFLRITEYPPVGAASGESIEFTLVTLRKRDGAWSQTVQSTPLRALGRATLERALSRAGFSSFQVYGSYAGAGFDAPGAADLIMVARAAPA